MSDFVDAVTSTGRVTLRPALVSFATPGAVLPTMQKLHRRALGEPTGTAALDALAPQRALVALSTAITASLGQIAVLDVAGANQVLKAVSSHASHDGLAGLHSLFFAALLSAARGDMSPELEAAVAVWNANGAPAVLPGGTITMPLLGAVDANRVTLVGASDLANAVSAPAAGLNELLTALGTLAPEISADDAEAPSSGTGAVVAVGRMLQALALATASTLALHNQFASTSPLVAVKQALEEWLTDDFDGPPPVLIPQGKALVVSVTLHGDAPEHQPAPAAGAPRTVLPRFEYTQESAASHDVWRSKEAPGFVMEGPGTTSLAVPGRESVSLLSLPRLRGTSIITPGSLFSSLVPRPPVQPSPPGVEARGPASTTKVASAVRRRGTGTGLGVQPPAHRRDKVVSLHAEDDLLHDPDPPNMVRFVQTEVKRLGLSDAATVGDLEAQWARELAVESP